MKWAVTCVNRYDCDVSSVDLFDDYESAYEFMEKDCNDTRDELFDDLEGRANIDIDNFGEYMTIYIEGIPELSWYIVPANTH